MFASTLEQMLDAQLSEHLGYQSYEAKGHNCGKSRNGFYSKNVRTSEGETGVRVPRERKASVADLKTICQASTLEQATASLH